MPYEEVEHPVIELAQLHRHRHRRQQHRQGRRQVGGDAMGAGKVVEGALRQHAHRAALAMGGLGHRIERAVAAHRHHRSAADARYPGGLRSGLRQGVQAG